MANAQVTQVAVEAVTKQTPNAELTQVAVEVLTHTNFNAQLTQVALEVMAPFVATGTPLVFAVT